MRILVVGSGGREHALTWKLIDSPQVSKIFVAPGNAGTASIAENVDVSATDLQGLVSLALQKRIDLVVVGPEVPLAMGLVDAMHDSGVPAFGPTQAAARLEYSKAFAHEIMDKCGVPAAASRVFTTSAAALDYLAGRQLPLVVKADGLAAGKGAIIVTSVKEAEKALKDILERRVFGEAGDRVVIEDFLEGWEVSLLAFTDGTRVAPMVPSCDYKRALDNDEGPNTGGMGCYSPPAFFDDNMAGRATSLAIMPVVHAMADAGWEYRGVIYAGLMVDEDRIRVLEFNARFGDPETQIVLPRLQSDLAGTLLSCVNGCLDPATIQWRPGCSVGVVIASGGYPGDYTIGYPITGLDRIDPKVAAFHAGTRLEEDGRIVTDGGRVMSLVATGDTMAEARERVYENITRISFSDMMYRTDIALREVA